MTEHTGTELTERKPSGAFTVVVIVAGIVVFAVAITVGLLTGSDSGSIAEWTAAIATVAAFIAAVYAGWFAHRALLVEQQRDRHRDRLERSSEALQVAVWGRGWYTAQKTVGHEVATGPCVPAELVASVQNAGELPVHDLWIQVYLPAVGDTAGWDLVADYEHGLLLPDAVEHIELLPTISVGVPLDNLRVPDSTSPMYVTLRREFAARGTTAEPPFVFALGCSFRDNDYVRWVRVPDVGVREMPRPRVPAAP